MKYCFVLLFALLASFKSFHGQMVNPHFKPVKQSKVIIIEADEPTKQCLVNIIRIVCEYGFRLLLGITNPPNPILNFRQLFLKLKTVT